MFRPTRFFEIGNAVAVIALLGVLALVPIGVRSRAADRPAVLVFTRTTGYRHASIPAAIQAVRDDGQRDGYTVVATEDPRFFTDAKLHGFRAVAFLLTTGTVLDAAQQDSLERFVRHGGGWLGVHSAADTEYDWPFYGKLVGAYFRHHPAIQSATVHVVDHRNLATAGLPTLWTRTDEWYDFRTNPSRNVHVLATVDERTYKGGEMGDDHPIAFFHVDICGSALYT
ncbi:MAG: ThuA domain-containing protein, partial [Chloroflexota bacterium]